MGSFRGSLVDRINSGASVKVNGKLVKSEGKNQMYELIASKIKILGEADPEIYPIQPKKHSYEKKKLFK